jgi:hypothetical protein
MHFPKMTLVRGNHACVGLVSMIKRQPEQFRRKWSRFAVHGSPNSKHVIFTLLAPIENFNAMKNPKSVDVVSIFLL